MDMDTDREPKSKSQVKREMLALQSLGERLFDLPADRIKMIEMPPELRDALLFGKTIRKGEARRRQIQYIGALMREIDPGPIEKVLDSIQRGHFQNTEHFKELERWRDELVGGNEGSLEEIVSKFPAADRRTLRRLALNARKEREENRPPKASRALFRLLKELSES